MTRNFLFVVAISSILVACGKSSSTTPTTPCNTVLNSPTVRELDSLGTLLQGKGITTATRDNRGFYYEVVDGGYGTLYPNLSSTVTAEYKGTLPDGSVFDSTATGTGATFPLSNVITGWKYGVPLIKKGGTINLYLTPALGYGCQNQSNIPANSILFFKVKILNF